MGALVLTMERYGSLQKWKVHSAGNHPYASGRTKETTWTYRLQSAVWLEPKHPFDCHNWQQMKASNFVSFNTGYRCLLWYAWQLTIAYLLRSDVQYLSVTIILVQWNIIARSVVHISMHRIVSAFYFRIVHINYIHPDQIKFRLKNNFTRTLYGESLLAKRCLWELKKVII